MAQDFRITPISLTQLQADTVTLFAMKAPSAGNGGGFTIVEASAVDDSATSAGTSWGISLHRYSALGTPAVNGTIAAEIGGTADPWVKGVPKNFTIVAAYAFVDAGEWVAIEKDEENSSDPQAATVTITWVPGHVTT